MASNTSVVSHGKGGLLTAKITHNSGAELEVYLHGGTITSFKTSAGQELFFASSEASYDGEYLHVLRVALCTVVFPNFPWNAHDLQIFRVSRF